uniref:hypothetical protein n=1 Tax=Winogradskyella poriferorum TaxID=307627 RepID=UPI003D654D55
VVRFPEESLGIIVFGNVSDIGASEKALKIADLLLPEKEEQNKEYDLTSIKEKVGRYYSDQGLLCELIDSTHLYLKFQWGVEQL